MTNSSRRIRFASQRPEVLSTPSDARHLIVCIAFGRLVVSSPGRDLSLAFMEAHFQYEEPVFVEPPSQQPTPQKKRVAQPLNWVRNSWMCDVQCGQCDSDKEALPLLSSANVTCNKSCSFDCARTLCDAARKQARSLRHDAYTQGTTDAVTTCDRCFCLHARI